MAEYSIVFARSARKELEDLPQLLKTRILNRIEQLSTNPRPAGVRKLVGSEYLWRLRIGDHRVIYGFISCKVYTIFRRWGGQKPPRSAHRRGQMAGLFRDNLRSSPSISALKIQYLSGAFLRMF